MNLNSVLIGSEDPKRLADYYTKLFGEPGWDEGGYTGWQIGAGVVSVGPHDQVKGKNREPGRVIWNVESSDVKGDFDTFVAGVHPDPGEAERRRLGPRLLDLPRREWQRPGERNRR